jgi:hypothetical protein
MVDEETGILPKLISVGTVVEVMKGCRRKSVSSDVALLLGALQPLAYRVRLRQSLRQSMNWRLCIAFGWLRHDWRDLHAEVKRFLMVG